MCNPAAFMFLRAAGTILSISQSTKEARAAEAQARRQNELAEKARIEKENAENLRIRQIAERKRDKAFDLAMESRERQATAITAAETVGGGVVDRALLNYLRLEGRYKSQIERNLENEIAQSNINKKLFGMEQEARTVVIPEVDTFGIFAANAIEFGGDYLEWKAKKDQKDQTEKTITDMMEILTG